MRHAVIMAGGGGTRLWPLSTPTRPKQLLKFDTSKTLVEETLDRLDTVVDAGNRWIVTVDEQVGQLKGLSPELGNVGYIIEPMGRNTAPCIGLAAMTIARRDPEAVLAILPADHLIQNVSAFRTVLDLAYKMAGSCDCIVTIGLTPTRPETGYGYIEVGDPVGSEGVHNVVSFREKPDAETAESYIASGHYLWNGGMFIVSAKTMLEEFRKYQPSIHAGLTEMLSHTAGSDEARKTYESLEKISIDYGIIEKSERVMVLPADMGWSDIGGYEELYRQSEKDTDGNFGSGAVLLEGSKDCYVRNDTTTPVAVLGVEGLTVVANDDGILICRTEDSQRVKAVQEWKRDT